MCAARSILIEYDNYDRHYTVDGHKLTVNWSGALAQLPEDGSVKFIFVEGAPPELILTVNEGLYRFLGTLRDPNTISMISERFERVNTTSIGVQIKEFFFPPDHPGLQFLTWKGNQHVQQRTEHQQPQYA